VIPIAHRARPRAELRDDGGAHVGLRLADGDRLQRRGFRRGAAGALGHGEHRRQSHDRDTRLASYGRDGRRVGGGEARRLDRLGGIERTGGQWRGGPLGRGRRGEMRLELGPRRPRLRLLHGCRRQSVVWRGEPMIDAVKSGRRRSLSRVGLEVRRLGGILRRGLGQHGRQCRARSARGGERSTSSSRGGIQPAAFRAQPASQ
jgi:hypothetical protein